MKNVPLTFPIRGWDGNPIAVDGKPLTVRELCLQYVGTFESENGKDCIIARKIGQRIYDCTEDMIALEDAEFNILERSMQKPRHIAIVMGHLLEIMDDVKNGKTSNENAAKGSKETLQ
jgi:hypothetical protein